MLRWLLLSSYILTILFITGCVASAPDDGSSSTGMPSSSTDTVEQPSSGASSSGSTFTTQIAVAASGTNEFAELMLLVDDTVVDSWLLGDQVKEHVYTISNLGASGNVKIFFTDQGNSDAFLDYIEVNGARYEAETQEINTSRWANGACGGGARSSILNCKGYVDFGEIPLGGEQRAAVPGKIEAENYVHYFDNDADNSGGAYRNDGVDISNAGKERYVISNFDQSEWLEYPIIISEQGHFAIEIMASTPYDNIGIALSLDGYYSGHITKLKNTHSFGNWQISRAYLGELAAGTHTLRLSITSISGVATLSNLAHVDWFRVVPSEDESVQIVQPRKSYPSGDSNSGEAVYLQQCAVCHGTYGEGNAGNPPLKNCATCDNFNVLAETIENTMPTFAPASCDEQCASDVSAYILDAFNEPIDVSHCEQAMPEVSSTPLKRLSRTEYINTLRSLLQTHDIDFSAVPQEPSKHHFNTLGEAQVVSKLALDAYIAIALKEASSLMADASRRDQVISCDYLGSECLPLFIADFGRLAFRRPLTDSEKNDLLTYAQNSADSTQQFIDVISAILTNPKFLYRLEIGLGESNWKACAREGGTCSISGIRRIRYGIGNQWLYGVEDTSAECTNDYFGGDPALTQEKRCEVSEIYGALTLDSYEIASKLAFSLWGEAPDRNLLNAAENGKFDSLSARRMVIRTMLTDPRAKAHLREFFAQWLGIHELTSLAPPVNLPSHWYDAIFHDMADETLDLVEHVAWSNASFFDIFTSNQTFMTPELARYYGMNSGVRMGDDIFGLADPRKNTGILSHGSSTFAKTDGDLVSIRGNWFRSSFLCKDIELPPGAVDVIAGKFAGYSPLDIIKARNFEPACKGCHAMIDPIGIAFSHLDGFSQHTFLPRPQDYPIPAGFPDLNIDHASLQDIAELASSMPEVGYCLAEKMFFYTRYQQMKVQDQCTVSRASEAFSQNQYDFIALIIALTEDGAFMLRQSPETSDK